MKDITIECVVDGRLCTWDNQMNGDYYILQCLNTGEKLYRKMHDINWRISATNKLKKEQ